jgi:hypothetical protein
MVEGSLLSRRLGDDPRGCRVERQHGEYRFSGVQGHDPQGRFQTSLNLGSTTTLTDDYFQGAKQVGSDQVACVMTGPGSLALCTATHMLPKGEIISAGSVTIPPTVNQAFTTAIVGGTGPYSTA